MEKIFNLKIFDAAVVLIGSHINQVWESIYMLWPPICSSQSEDNLTDRGYLRLHLQLRVFFFRIFQMKQIDPINMCIKEMFLICPWDKFNVEQGVIYANMQNWQFLHSRIFVYYFQTMIYIL